MLHSSLACHAVPPREREESSLPIILANRASVDGLCTRLVGSLHNGQRPSSCVEVTTRVTSSEVISICITCKSVFSGNSPLTNPSNGSLAKKEEDVFIVPSLHFFLLLGFVSSQAGESPPRQRDGFSTSCEEVAV